MELEERRSKLVALKVAELADSLKYLMLGCDEKLMKRNRTEEMRNLKTLPLLGCFTIAKCGVRFEEPSLSDFMAMPLDKPLEMANLKLMVTNRDEKTNYLVGALLELSNGRTSEIF